VAKPDRSSPAAPKAAVPDAQKPGGSTGTGEPGQNKHKQSGAAAPTAPSRNAGLEALKRKAQSLQKAGAKNKKTQGGKPPNQPIKPGAEPQDVFVANAKRVCATLRIDGLAKRYHVAADADSVATAYAASYPPSYRTAVHDGCKSALAGR
jgi:hypothetical protein